LGFSAGPYTTLDIYMKMKKLFYNKKVLIALMVIFALLFILTKPIQKYQATRLKDTLLSRFKTNWPDLKILTKVHSPIFFPVQWRTPDVHAKALRVDEDNYLRALNILAQELEKYSTSVVKHHLKAVALCSKLSLYGIDYGGTNIENRIYLTVLSPREGYTDDYIRKTINHEFSSILIRDFKFPIKKWISALPSTVSYADSLDQEVKAIEAGREFNEPSENELNAGFLAAYGRTNYENDINTYAGMLFTDPIKLRELAEKYPVIDTKYKLIVNFYKSLDPHFKWLF
jgi:hypothetical protein